MPFYKVRPGYEWGINHLPSGTVIKLTEHEAAGLGFKLERVDERLVTNPADETGAGEAWGTVPERVVDVLESAGLTPELVANMTDDELLAVDKIGPSTVNAIREGLA